MNLPKDLKKYALGRLFKKLVPFVLLEGVVAAVVILFGERLFGKTGPGFRIPATVILFLVPVFITKIYTVLADSTWYGTVKNVSVKTVMVQEAFSKGEREGTYMKNMIYLTLEEPSGKTKIRKADEEKLQINRGKLGGGTNTSEAVTGRFCEGVTAFHLYGTDRAVVIPPSDSRCDRECAVCLSDNPAGTQTCRVCGHTIVSHEMLTK